MLDVGPLTNKPLVDFTITIPEPPVLPGAQAPLPLDLPLPPPPPVLAAPTVPT